MPNLSSTIKLGLDSSAVKRGVQDMKSRFQQLGTVIKGSMAVGATATFAYFNRFRQEMDRIGKLSKRLEIAPETLQRVGLAAELAGQDLESVVKGGQKLVQALVKGEDGAKTYKRALEALGLSGDRLLRLPLDEQLIQISRAYSESNRGGRDQAAILDLMGRQGAELIPLLRDGPEALAEAMDKAKPVSADVVEKMEELNDQLAVMQQNMQHTFADWSTEAYDAITGLANGLTTLFAHASLRFRAWRADQRGALDEAEALRNAAKDLAGQGSGGLMTEGALSGGKEAQARAPRAMVPSNPNQEFWNEHLKGWQDFWDEAKKGDERRAQDPFLQTLAEEAKKQTRLLEENARGGGFAYGN